MADRLAEIRAREQSATEGPWTWDRDEPIKPHYLTEKPEKGRVLLSELVTTKGTWVATATEYTAWCEDPPGEAELSTVCMREADAEFIAHSREDIPFLLAALDRERERADDAEARAEGLIEGIRAISERYHMGICVACDEPWERHAMACPIRSFATAPRPSPEEPS